MNNFKNAGQPVYFRPNTTDTLRGIAIILLILGHYCGFCIDGIQAFEHSGEIAVIIFLMLSGIGLTKTYGFKKCDKLFLLKRLRRLIFPLWITLILFYLLDFFLLNKTYPISDTFIKFIGILRKSPPNSPLWFISYIIFLYTVFYFVSIMKIGPYFKFLSILIICYITSIIIKFDPNIGYFFGGWTTYTFVFPISILIALNEKKISTYLQILYNRHPSLILIILIIIGSVFVFAPRLKTLFLIIFVVISAYYLDMMRVKLKPLSWLGKYSLEIYLLHFPFLVSYGFVIGKKPAIAYLGAYILFILFLSIVLKKTSEILNNSLLPSN